MRPTLRLPLPLPVPLLVLGLSLLTVLGWWLPNRPRGEDVGMPAARFNGVSFAPFRDGQSPLADRFPTAAQVAADVALLAPQVRSLRTYAALEGEYEVAAIAARHGLRVWQGAWLGQDLRQNERELARAIELANRHPETVERLVIGNEVLLRRDLPPAQLIAALDRVRAAVRQPVTYADVWEFWEQFPEVAAHVDIVTIHILPYWEDVPRGVDDAVAHTAAVLRHMRARFPGKPIAIGEIGWPSRGRSRGPAVPSRVNQAIFLRQVMALATAEGLDWNLIEAFDQGWKYRNEGTVGAAWGLFSADRRPSFPLRGGVVERPEWRWYAGAAVALTLLLLAAASRFGARASLPLVLLCAALGNALALAWAGTVPLLFDRHLLLAGSVNLAGQGLLAALLLRHVARRLRGAPGSAARTGADTTTLLRGVLRGRAPPAGWRDGALDYLGFLFLWAAMLLQLLLLIDPRYRDFPFASFAVPLVAIAARAWLGDLPRQGGGREEAVAGGVLALAALGSAWREGAANHAAMAWTVCALVLAAPALLSLRGRLVAWRRRRVLPSMVRPPTFGDADAPP